MKSKLKVLSLMASSMVIGFVLAMMLVLPNSCIPFEPEPKNCIPFEKVDLQYVPLERYLKDVGRFKNEVAVHIEKEYDSLSALNADFKGKLPSRHCTFSLPRLKSFIHEIDSLAKVNGRDPKDMAITWSYAIYDHSEDHQGDADLRSMQTLYGLPSERTEKGAYEPVDLYNSFKPLDEKVIKIVEQGMEFGRDERSGILSNGENGDGPDAFNRGHLCPAVCSRILQDVQNGADTYNNAMYGTLNANQ